MKRINVRRETRQTSRNAGTQSHGSKEQNNALRRPGSHVLDDGGDGNLFYGDFKDKPYSRSTLASGMVDHHRGLDIYKVAIGLLFLWIWHSHPRPSGVSNWTIFVASVVLVLLFELRPIRQPKSEHIVISLSTPFLLCISLTLGLYPALLILLCTLPILLLQHWPYWLDVLFNTGQSGLTLFTAMWLYLHLGGVIGHIHEVNMLPLVAYLFVYFLVNTALTYTVFRWILRWSVGQFFWNISPVYILFYVFQLFLGLGMTFAWQVVGLPGLLLFAIGVTINGVAINLYNRLVQVSIHDELTDLYNRRYFHETMTQVLRHGHTVTLLLLDLDHFKKYNDQFGHPVGDRLLQDVSKLIHYAVGRNGLACRYGGEEFAVLLPGIDAIQAGIMAEEIREIVGDYHFFTDAKEYIGNLTLSIGVATYPDMAETKEELLERADRALYLAKDQGRNTVITYPSTE
jgi:diguanylate cyclase (GGDEF)-like protein